jgi:glycosyltransferase involved in cell wall biosynthesis
LACVVLSVGNPPELTGAVQSLLDQQHPVELVVVNSGGGDATSSLARFEQVRVIDRPDLLLPGAARNLGLAATSAPYIAFLAADCIAEAGWVRARLTAHELGAPAVASAVTNPYRRNLIAWTMYVSLFSTRMPGTPSDQALLYGASYERGLFERFGLFREDMRGGEDTEFHQRLAPEITLRWAPEVRTAHRHPRTPWALLSDHFRRGRRTAAAWDQLDTYGELTVAKNVVRRAPTSARTAWRAAAAGERRWVVGAAALLVWPTAAYALGALSHAVAPAGGAQR